MVVCILTGGALPAGWWSNQPPPEGGFGYAITPRLLGEEGLVFPAEVHAAFKVGMQPDEMIMVQA